MTHDPMKSAAADTAATAAAYSARHTYALGWEAATRQFDHVRAETEKQLGEITRDVVEADSERQHMQEVLDAAESRLAVEVAGREVAEQRVCDLVTTLKSTRDQLRDEVEERHCAGDCVDGDGQECSSHQRINDADAALDSTADIAGRWVPKDDLDDARLALAEISELVGSGGDDTPFGRVESLMSRLTGERDAAEVRAEGLQQLIDAEADLSAEELDEVRAERDTAIADRNRACATRDAAIARAEKAEAIADRAAWSAQNAHDLLAAAERSRDESHADAMEKLDLAIAATKARDEVGIQYAAAQTEIFRQGAALVIMRDALAAIAAPEPDGPTGKPATLWMERRALDALARVRALDTVPGDALAPVGTLDGVPVYVDPTLPDGYVRRVPASPIKVGDRVRILRESQPAYGFAGEEGTVLAVDPPDETGVYGVQVSGIGKHNRIWWHTSDRIAVVPTSPAGVSGQPVDTEDPTAGLLAASGISNVKGGE